MRIFLAIAFICGSAGQAAEWNQWRGPNRDGRAPDSPPLIDALPDDGLEPAWITDERVTGGGWASPVVADGRVYLQTHLNERRPGVELPPEEYPNLTDEQKAELSEAELNEYEQKRRAEQTERRAKQFRWLDVVQCYDAETGEALWQKRFESGQSAQRHSSTPAVADGRLYLLGADVAARCLSAEDGKLLWETPLAATAERRTLSNQNVPSSPAIADGVFVALAGGLHGVDAGSGELLWSAEETMPGQYSSPAVWQSDEGPLVVVHTEGGQTVCVEPRTGRLRWRVKTGANRSSPVVVGDRLVILGGSRKTGLRCYRLTIDGAEEAWAFQGVADPGASPVVADGKAFAQGDRRLVAVDLESGEPVWRTTLDADRTRYSSPIAADGKLICTYGGVQCFDATAEDAEPLFLAVIRSEDGLLAPEDFFRERLGIEELQRTAEGQAEAEKLWNNTIRNGSPMECTSAAFADGRLYLRLQNGRLACYDLRRKS